MIQNTMLTTESSLGATTSQMDDLLALVCIDLELPNTLLESAREKYDSVGRWLCEPGSSLRRLDPTVYPQGSMLIGTTVRPRGREEYDVDGVCLLQLGNAGVSPGAVYEMVQYRLAENRTYAERLEPKNRCLRLNYAGQFHMDILPAIPDLRRGGTCILVPDRRRAEWKESNPKGFATWFGERAATRLAREMAGVEPLPVVDHDKPTLNRVVQLLKRRRDIYFDGAGDPARSVVLTTLCGEFYDGRPGISTGLASVVGRIDEWARGTTAIPEVRNPSNRAENFAERWDAGSFGAFRAFVSDFRSDLSELMTATGFARISAILERLFGEKPVKRALESYAGRIQKLREDGGLRRDAAASLTTAAGMSKIPRNTFFGGSYS